jgi:hypothetical protein
MTKRSRIFAGLAAEIVFTILPLLVVLMVLLHAQRATHFFAAPEWAFGAAILFGQTLVKFVSGLARGGSAATGPVALFVALLVVFGLVPSLFVLYITLEVLVAQPNEPGRWLQISQVVLFWGAVAMYLVLGTVGETWSKMPEQR